MSKADLNKYDINSIIIKPLYLGLTLNILIPAGLIYFCYYLNSEGNRFNQVGEFAYTLFIVIAVVSVIQAAAAFYLRNQLLKTPLIKNEETFSSDMTEALMKRSVRMFILVMLISVYAFAYYMFSAKFDEALMLVVFSFVVFQVLRPRHGFARKLVEKQEEFVKNGKFAK